MFCTSTQAAKPSLSAVQSLSSPQSHSSRQSTWPLPQKLLQENPPDEPVEVDPASVVVEGSPPPVSPDVVEEVDEAVIGAGSPLEVLAGADVLEPLSGPPPLPDPPTTVVESSPHATRQVISSAMPPANPATSCLTP